MSSPLTYESIQKPQPPGLAGPPMRWHTPRVVLLALLCLFLSLMMLSLLVIALVDLESAVTVACACAGPLGVLLILVVAMRFGAQALRHRRGMTVLGYVEQAVRLNLPLPRMLWAAQQGESGLVAQRLGAVEAALEGGVPLSTALESQVPELPRRAVHLARAGEALGQLPATLRRLLREDRRQDHGEVSERIFAVVYPLFMILALCGGLAFSLVFVLPKFQRVFTDFRVPLPDPLIWMSRVGVYLAPTALILILVGASIYLGLKLRELLAPYWGPKVQGPALWDHVLWHTPLWGKLLCHGGLGDALGVIGQAMDSGFPLDRALAQADGLKLNGVLRQHLRQWQAHLTAGLSASEAARQAGLPPLVSGMLATAELSGDAPAALKFLAHYYTGQFSRGLILLRAAVVPALAIFFGIIIGLMALGLFMPMVELIKTVMPQKGVL